MSRYLAMLKDETEKYSQNPDPLALSKLPKPPFDSFGSREGSRICEKNDQFDRNEPFPERPAWEHEWKRLSSMKNCPLRSGKRGRGI